MKIEMERLRDRQNRSWDGMFYSSQRLDLLIVSISGAGIYVCLETIKYLRDGELPIDYIIKISGIVFLLSIIINFISQIYNHSANSYDYLLSECKLDNIEASSEDNIEDIKLFKSKITKYNKRTRILNYWSAGLMFAGLIFIMLYFTFFF